VGLPRPETRAEAAARDGSLHPADRGLREWLEDVELARRGQPVAVWDTRKASPRILDTVDRSSRTIAKRLRRAGAQVVSDPAKFSSSDGKGGPVDGQEQRAREWGAHLARRPLLA
jgi:hypothetical protein